MEKIAVELVSLLPTAWGNYLSMALFLLLALLLWRVPKGLIETGSESKPRYLDLRWWATALIAIQLAIYWVFN